MSVHTNHQIITHNGMPVAVVIPYAEYQELVGEAAVQDKEATIPHEVMRLVVKGKRTPIAAWREHLGLTQEEVARRMDVQQSTYARMESGKVEPRISTLRRIAEALGIEAGQLDI